MKTRLIPFILSTLALSLLVAFPDVYLSASFDGIKIFVINVLPALLPFFFFTKLISNLGFVGSLSKSFNTPCKFLYNTSGIGGYVFLSSVLSGYPIGAKTLSDMYENGEISLSDAQTIMSFTSTSGPMFIVGSVGSIMLHNKTYGFIILLCHYLSAILNGVLYRNKSKSSQPHKKQIVIGKNLLSKSISDTVSSVLISGAYIAIFYMIAVMLKNVGFLNVISDLLNLIFHNKALCDGISFGLVEMTGGCALLSSTSSPFTLPAICAIISFGGLSVTLQSLTFLGNCNIKPTRYLLSKATQSIISFCLTYLVVVFCL